MYLHTSCHSRLIGTGAHIPETAITSRDLMEEIDSQSRFGVKVNWLERTTGIRERRVAPVELQPSDLAVIAARDAFARAESGERKVRPEDIDVLIFTGVSRDFHEPATAHVVAHKLGLHVATAFDVSNACHGFVNAIHIMDALIATGQARYGLIVTGEASSRGRRDTIEHLKRTTNRDTFMKLCFGLTVGDCGAAMIVGPKQDPQAGFMGFMMESQSKYYSYSTCGPECGNNVLEVDMTPIIQEGLDMWSAMYPHFMQKMGWKPDEIAACALHQASKGMIQRIASYMDVDPALCIDTVSTMGNLVSGNVPIGLHLLAERKLAKPGDKVVIVGGGSGIVASHLGLIWE